MMKRIPLELDPTDVVLLRLVMDRRGETTVAQTLRKLIREDAAVQRPTRGDLAAEVAP